MNYEMPKDTEMAEEEDFIRWELMKQMNTLWHKTMELWNLINWELCERVDNASCYHGVYFPCNDNL